MNTKRTPLSPAPVRILVVDDFEPARRTICSIFDKTELQVIGEAGDGIEALEKAQDLKPDLILLDIGLPKLNGIEVASRLCYLVPHTKILFVSQQSDPDIVRAALSNGARGYVLKAHVGHELLPAAEAVLRGERFVSSTIKRRTVNRKLVEPVLHE